MSQSSPSAWIEEAVVGALRTPWALRKQPVLVRAADLSSFEPALVFLVKHDEVSWIRVSDGTHSVDVRLCKVARKRFNQLLHCLKDKHSDLGWLLRLDRITILDNRLLQNGTASLYLQAAHICLIARTDVDFKKALSAPMLDTSKKLRPLLINSCRRNRSRALGKDLNSMSAVANMDPLQALEHLLKVGRVDESHFPKYANEGVEKKTSQHRY